MISYHEHSNPNILTPPELLAKAVKEMNVELDLWCEDKFMPDKPHWAFDNFRTGGAMDYGASHLFYTQPSWGKHFIDRMEINKVKCVTYAIDEDVYPEVKSEQIYDVGFIGNCDQGDGRQPYLELLNEKFNFYHSTTTPTGNISTDLSKCKVLFNHLRFEEINIRFFEALASGAQVVSYSPALHLFAEEGKHYLTFKTPEEMVEKINYLLEHDIIREQMRKDARHHVLQNHTYKHRVKEMLDFI